jgi:hypothetical protein
MNFYWKTRKPKPNYQDKRVRKHGQKEGNETVEEIGAARRKKPRHTTKDEVWAV